MDNPDDLKVSDDPKSLKSARMLAGTVKVKKKSLVERELETSLTPKAVSPVTLGDGSSTSRYGRARKVKKNFCDTDEVVSSALKSPKPVANLIKDVSPLSKTDKEVALPTKNEIPTPKLIPVGKSNLKKQIEKSYDSNIPINFYSTDKSNTAQNKTNNLSDTSPSKTYIRKDLIQTNVKEKTYSFNNCMFSPPKKINTHLNNILERSSEKYELSPAKSPTTPTKTKVCIKITNKCKLQPNITSPKSKPQITWIKSNRKTGTEKHLEVNKSSGRLDMSMTQSLKQGKKHDSPSKPMITDSRRSKKKNPPSLDYILERLSLEKGLIVTKTSPRAAAQSAKSIILQKSVTSSPQVNCSKNINQHNTTNSPNANSSSNIVNNSRGGRKSFGSLNKSLNVSESSVLKPEVNDSSTPISGNSQAKLNGKSNTKSRLQNLDRALLSQSLDSSCLKTKSKSILNVSKPTKSAGNLLSGSRKNLVKSALSKSFDNVMVNIPASTEKFMRLAAQTGRSNSNLEATLANSSKPPVKLNKTIPPNPIIPSKVAPRNRRSMSKSKPRRTLSYFCQNLFKEPNVKISPKTATPNNVTNLTNKEVVSDTRSLKQATPNNYINLAENEVKSDTQSSKPPIVHTDKSSVVKTLDFDCNKKGKKGGNEPKKPTIIQVPNPVDLNCHKKSKKGSKEPVKPDLPLEVLIEMELKCKYQDGDVAWARMGTFPFWPCLISREPGTGMLVKRKLFGRIERDIIHVTFLGDNGRRNWVVETMLRPFLGRAEFEATRDRLTPEDKKKDPRFCAAFFISEKKLGLWGLSVDEAETLYKAPKEFRIEILYEILGLTNTSLLKPIPEMERIVRSDSDVSLSASLFETLFSEDDDDERPGKRKSLDSKHLDVSEVVTACLDNMAAKTGLSKIQKQSHMDIWLHKAKSMTPEKLNVTITVERLNDDEEAINQAEDTQNPIEKPQKPSKETKVALKEQQSSSKKKTKPMVMVKKPYSLRRAKCSNLKTKDYPVNEHDYSIKVDNIENCAGTVNDAVPTKTVRFATPLNTSENVSKVSLNEASAQKPNEYGISTNMDNEMSKMDVDIEVSVENCLDDTKIETNEIDITQKDTDCQNEPAILSGLQSVSDKAAVYAKTTVNEEATVSQPETFSDQIRVTPPSIVSKLAPVSEQITVSEPAIDSEQVIVCGKTTVTEETIVSQPETFSEQATVSDQIRVTQPSIVSEPAPVSEQITVSQPAIDSEQVIVCGKTTVTEEATVSKPETFSEQATVSDQIRVTQPSIVSKLAPVSEQITVSEPAIDSEQVVVSGKTTATEEATASQPDTFSDQATVSEPAIDSEQVVVSGKTTVTDKATVYEPAIDSEQVIVSGKSTVTGEATVFQPVTFSEQATVSKQALVSEAAIDSKQVIISGNENISDPVTVSELSIKGVLIEDVQTKAVVSQLDDPATNNLAKIDQSTKESFNERFIKITDAVLHEKLAQVDKITEKLVKKNNITPIDNCLINVTRYECNTRTLMMTPEKQPEDYESPPSAEIPYPEHSVTLPDDSKYNQIIDISLKHPCCYDISEINYENSTKNIKPLVNSNERMPSETESCSNNSDIIFDQDKYVLHMRNVNSDSVISAEKAIDKPLESNNNMKEIISDKIVNQDKTILILKIDHESDKIPAINSVSVASKEKLAIEQLVSHETNTNNHQGKYSTIDVNEAQHNLHDKDITEGISQTQKCHTQAKNLQDKDVTKEVNHTQDIDSGIVELPKFDKSFTIMDDDTSTKTDLLIETPVLHDLNEIAEKHELSPKYMEEGFEKLEEDNEHEVTRYEIPVVNLDESHSNSVDFYDSIPVTGDGEDEKTSVKNTSIQDHISFDKKIKLFDVNGLEENEVVKNINDYDDDETDCEDPMSPTFTQNEDFEETKSIAFLNISKENARTSSPTYTQTENFNEGYESPTFTQNETETFDFDQEVDDLGVKTTTSLDLRNKWNIIPVCGTDISTENYIPKQRRNMTDVNVCKLLEKKIDPVLKTQVVSVNENSTDYVTPNVLMPKQDDIEDLFNQIDELCNENDKLKKTSRTPYADNNTNEDNIDKQNKSNKSAYNAENSKSKGNFLIVDKLDKQSTAYQKNMTVHINGHSTDEQIELITNKDISKTIRKTNLRLSRTKNNHPSVTKVQNLNNSNTFLKSNANNVIELTDTKNNLDMLNHNSSDIVRDKNITLGQCDNMAPKKVLKVVCQRISNDYLNVSLTKSDVTDSKVLEGRKLSTKDKTDTQTVTLNLTKNILTITDSKTHNDSDNDSMSSELDNITLSELKVIADNKKKDPFAQNNNQSEEKNEITNDRQSDKNNKILPNVRNDLQCDTLSIQSSDGVSELSDIEGFNIPIKTLRRRRSNKMKRLSTFLDSRNSSPMTDSDIDLATLRSREKYLTGNNEKVVNGFKESRDSTPDATVKEINIKIDSLESDEENGSVSKRQVRPEKNLRVKNESINNKQEPEFLKYLELKQYSLMDEHPELNKDQIVDYLYDRYTYQESIKSEQKKSDDIEQSTIVKGTDFNSKPKKVKKAKLSNKEKARAIDIQKLFSQDIKSKPKRKSAVKSYVDEFSDIEEQIDIFEIFKAKNQSKSPVAGKRAATEPNQQVLIDEVNALNVELQEVDKVSKVKSENEISANVDIKSETEILTNICENTNKIEIEPGTSENPELIYDEVEEYFKQLTMPKPNVFKGLTREKVCEICERSSDLVKCKSCNGRFHVKCTKDKEKLEAAELARGRKKKKTRGRKPKGWVDMDDSNSDDKNFDPDVSAESNNSVEERAPITVGLDDFEEKAAARMKEILEKDIAYESYSSDDGIDWNNSVPGKCDIVDVKLKPRSQPVDISDFKCPNCIKHETPICCVCKNALSPKGQVATRQKCQVAHCHKYYHIECLEPWPQTQFHSGEPSRKDKKTSEHFEALTCPRHVCHTCVCDDPRGCRTRFSADKLARCVRCPATYHTFTKCLPAGTQILTGSHIICPRHHEVINTRPGRVSCHVNTGWCFICAQGGSLICCEYCPTSFHAECLQIKPPEGGYMCEDCETGRLPLYGEIVWVKLGHYRWWPGVILHPCEIPENIMAVKHSLGEFVVRFFGQYDYYWVNRGRVFPFHEGDSGRISSQKSKIDEAFTLAMEHAHRAFAIVKNAQPNVEESMDIQSSLLPPHYVKLKVNKPCGSLCKKKIDIEESSLTQCNCDPNMVDPCGPDARCLNRILLTECGPNCRAGDLCNNRDFEKRNYPKLVPYRTPHRGWGLKTLEPIQSGQFVIEYVGELIDEEEFRRRMQRQHEIRDENFYFLTLDKERMIDAGPKGNLARFMNHSCDPNCETQKWTVLGDVRVGLFARKYIPANTEVNFNYNLECAGIDKKRCMCGAKRCAGYIGAKPKQEEKEVQPKKSKQLNQKRPYKKKAKALSAPTEPTPSTSTAVTPSTSISNSGTPPKRKRGRPRKQRELTEIEKDLLIIKNATNGISSDSESINSLRNETERKYCETLKRKRASVSLSTDEMTSYDDCSSPCVKRMKTDEGTNVLGDSDVGDIVALPMVC